MQEVLINDVDVGDVIIRNNERYVCIDCTACQDDYYSVVKAIKESDLLNLVNGESTQTLIYLKNNHDLITLECYDFEDEIIYMSEKAKYKDCFVPLILFKKMKG